MLDHDANNSQVARRFRDLFMANLSSINSSVELAIKNDDVFEWIATKVNLLSSYFWTSKSKILRFSFDAHKKTLQVTLK